MVLSSLTLREPFIGLSIYVIDINNHQHTFLNQYDFNTCLIGVQRNLIQNVEMIGEATRIPLI